MSAVIRVLVLLAGILATVRADAQEQRRLADEASAAVRQLDQAISQLERDHHELKLREREYQNQIDALLVNVTVLEKRTEVPDVALDDTNKKQASPVSLD